MYQLKYELIGKAGGDFRPKYTEPEQSVFLEKLKAELNKRGLTNAFAPHCNLTTNVAQLGDEKQVSLKPWLVRTKPGYDGAMVTDPGVAIALFNGDCPVVILFDRKKGHLVLLHAGFRCLIPQEYNKPSIISEALNHFPLDPNELEAFIGFGTGSCCYGIDNHINKLDKSKYLPFLSVATKGPRQGQKSINLHTLACHQLRNCGIHGPITIDHSCTACYGRRDATIGKYYSNIYEGPETGRNLVLVWFK